MEEAAFLDDAREALGRLDGGARPIVLMDSGVGGLPYLEAARRMLSGERYAYLADRAGFPYGTKSREEIEGIVLDRLSRLVSAFDPKAIVIACNTASQAALAAARLRFPGIPIVGTVPAVKPAALHSHSGVIGVMATEHALVDPYLDELIMSHAPGTRVLREPAQGLVSFVEHDFLSASAEARHEAVLPHVRRLIEAGADEIVLACTHFLHVAEDIRGVASALLAESDSGGRRVEVVDSREGVARRLREVLAGMGLLARPEAPAIAMSGSECGSEGGRDGVFLLSGPPPFESVYQGFSARFRLLGPYSLEGKR
jgi:glutamate racemase